MAQAHAALRATLGEERAAAMGLLAMGAGACPLTAEDEAALEAGMLEFGREFHTIRLELVPTRSVFDLQVTAAPLAGGGGGRRPRQMRRRRHRLRSVHACPRPSWYPVAAAGHTAPQLAASCLCAQNFYYNVWKLRATQRSRDW